MSETPEEIARKLERAKEELAGSGIWRSNALPPLYRLLAKVWPGLRPPHYERFWINALTVGPVFGLIWGGIMWFVYWSEQGLSALVALGAAALAGVLFGVAMALYYRISARRAGLSRWEDL